ncbi:MAG: flagellar basal body-associated protein FliL [Planctomycetota bacterium]
MSDHAKPEAAPAEGHEKASGGSSIVPWLAVGVISAGLGSAMPLLMGGTQHPVTAEEGAEGGDEHTEQADADHGTPGQSHGTSAGSEKKQKKVKAFTLPKEEETIFLPFADGEKDSGIVVNLDEGRLTRYLRIAITMQIPKASEEEFKKKLETRKIFLRNWLLSKISDLDIDDIRGAAGQNRLRREIRDQFNSVLCPDGYDQIYDVLFEEFNVQ